MCSLNSVPGFHRLPSVFLATQISSGLSPNRHAGEALLAVVLARLAHSGYPLDLDMSCKESPDRCGTCAICRTANYHTGAGNCQYPWCDLNVPLVTTMVKQRMYFLLPGWAKKMPEEYLAL